MPPFQDLTGKKYGQLLVVSRAESRDGKTVYWNCVCDCGKNHVTVGNLLKNGCAVSCGCYRIMVSSQRNGKHRLTGTAEFRAWRNMKNRCQNPNSDHYKYYGERGISVCDKWQNSFENFINDMGMIEGEKTSLDRIDVNKGYYPENCRWVTLADQNRNKNNNVYVIFNNNKITVTEFGRLTGITMETYKRNKLLLTPDEMYHRRHVLKKRYLIDKIHPKKAEPKKP